jgi:hypothetical protein
MLTASDAVTGQPKAGETKGRVPRLRKRRNQRKAEEVMPVKGFEIALAYHGNAYRAVYAVQVGEDV